MAGRAQPVRLAAAALLVAFVAGCGQPQPLPRPAAPAASYRLPSAVAAWYGQAAARGEAVLRIDAQRSLIVATVRRGGTLAHLGHDHVVASHRIDGLVAPASGRADFGFRLDAMAVDEADLRSQARLDTRPSPEAIAGTRTNMLTRVLDAEHFPEVALQVRQQAGAATAQLTVSLHGISRSIDVPMQLAPSSEAGSIVASGSFTLRQSDFGIVPMSIMGGAMTVADAMELRYQIVAVPQRPR